MPAMEKHNTKKKKQPLYVMNTIYLCYSSWLSVEKQDQIQIHNSKTHKCRIWYPVKAYTPCVRYGCLWANMFFGVVLSSCYQMFAHYKNKTLHRWSFFFMVKTTAEWKWKKLQKYYYINCANFQIQHTSKYCLLRTWRASSKQWWMEIEWMNTCWTDEFTAVVPKPWRGALWRGEYDPGGMCKSEEPFSQHIILPAQHKCN